MIKIGKASGFDLYYDESRRFFVIRDADGAELGHGDTQTEAEGKAKSLSKQEFKHIPIVRVVDNGQTAFGELTSLNRDDCSAWVSMKPGQGTYGSGRNKIDLKYHREYYEDCAANSKIITEIQAKRQLVETALEQITQLIKTLQHRIGESYFDMKK